MNPFQKNKVDVSALSAEEQKAFRMYGKLPNRKDVLQNKLKERKYFDSGDYALSKAGKSSEISPTDVGREHPVPENIPHISSPLPAGGPLERSGSISGASGSASPPAGTPSVPTTNASTSATGGPSFNTPTGGPSFNAPTGGSSAASAKGYSTGGSTMGVGTQMAGSPVKEGSYLSRETSIDASGREVHAEHRRDSVASSEGVSPPAQQRQGVPIRGRIDS